MVDIRLYGAKCDGITNDVSAINNTLADGDALIQDCTVLIGSSILIPSNRTLYLSNCKIRIADNSWDNIFRNANPDTGNVNVSVIALGNAVIDHNTSGNNDPNYVNYGGQSHSAQNLYKAGTFFFCNTTNFNVKGLTFSDRPHYCASIQQSSFGEITDIFFNHYTDCTNQDGIQNIFGTHHVTYKRVFGRTGDDFVSIFLGTFFGTLFYPLPNYNLYGHCHNIVWDDMIIHSAQHSFILICGDGKKIYDVTFKNAYVIYNLFMAYINSTYCSIPSTKDECYNINVENVEIKNSYAWCANLELGTNMKNVSASFINPSSRYAYRVWMRTPAYVLENVSVNGVQLSGRTWTDANKPSNLTATVVSNGIKLDWINNESNVSSIKIYVSTDGINFSELETLIDGTNTYTHQIKDGVKRYYRVRALCGAFSGYSNIVEATAPT